VVTRTRPHRDSEAVSEYPGGHVDADPPIDLARNTDIGQPKLADRRRD